ncbi:MAG TPA: TIGR02453 family protein, partial [Polyangia bacterium]|nr:TIGR02453 family protein [Polyangia bacterium]
MGAFQGFDRDAMQFWHELASEMSKEWFTANKRRYQSVWVEPMLALLRDVARGLARTYKPHALAEPGVLRIYRDLRFARDRAPYKTHIAGIIRFDGAAIAEAGNAVLYLHLGLDEEYVGVGCYRFDDARVARWRRAVVGAPGRELLRIIATLRRKGYDAGPYEQAARVPKGFAPDHPRAEL